MLDAISHRFHPSMPLSPTDNHTSSLLLVYQSPAHPYFLTANTSHTQTYHKWSIYTRGSPVPHPTSYRVTRLSGNNLGLSSCVYNVRHPSWSSLSSALCLDNTSSDSSSWPPQLPQPQTRSVDSNLQNPRGHWSSQSKRISYHLHVPTLISRWTSIFPAFFRV